MNIIWTLQRTISVTVALLLLCMVSLLFIKKSNFSFLALSYIMTYGSMESARRYFGKNNIMNTVLLCKYPEEECRVATIHIMKDYIRTDENVKRQLGLRNLLKDICDENENIPDFGLDIKSMKRVDLGISDREVLVEYKVRGIWAGSPGTMCGKRTEIQFKFVLKYKEKFVVTVNRCDVTSGKVMYA